MLTKFFFDDNDVIDPIIKVSKRYINTKKEKFPRWMRFEREFPDLYREKKQYKRNMNDLCNPKKQNQKNIKKTIEYESDSLE